MLVPTTILSLSLSLPTYRFLFFSETLLRLHASCAPRPIREKKFDTRWSEKRNFLFPHLIPSLDRETDRRVFIVARQGCKVTWILLESFFKHESIAPIRECFAHVTRHCFRVKVRLELVYRENMKMWKGKLNICLKWAKLDVGDEWRWGMKLDTYYFCKEKIVELCYWKRIGGFCLKFYFKIDR